MKQKQVADEWDSYGYTKLYYFRRQRMIWLLLPLIILVAAAIFLAPHYLLDPNFHANWHMPNYHGRQRGLAILIAFCIYLFLLLPIWIKAPIAALGFNEVLIWLITMLGLSFDRKPDFAIGPKGIYGLSRLKYYHVPWSEVGGVSWERRVTTLYEQNHLTIYTEQKSIPHWFWTRGKDLPVRFLFPPISGIDLNSVVSELEKYRPEKKIRRYDTDLRPKIFRH